MRRPVLLLLCLAIFGVSTACGKDATVVRPGSATGPTGPSGEPGPSGGSCGKPGSATDIKAEPNYPVDYLFRWTTAEGCRVRLDVLVTRRTGSDFHCGPSWPPDLLMGTPLGKATRTSAPRVYVRDPEGFFGDAALREGFASDIDPPSGVVDTGYRQDDTQLWMDPHDDRFVYLVGPDGTERWPKAEHPPGCA